MSIRLFRPTLLATLVLVALAAGALAGSGTEVPGRVLLALAPGQTLTIDKNADGIHTGVAAIDAVIAKHGVTSIEPLFGGMIESFDDPETRADLARHYLVLHAGKSGNTALNTELSALGVVEEAISDMAMPAHGQAYIPNDLAGPQWFLRNSSVGGSDVRALGGWAETLGDSNVIVAVCDSGVDWHHPDLGGPHPDHVNGAVWTNWAEYYGTPDTDDDLNGFVDDFRGWDFVNVSEGAVMEGEDFGPPDNDPADFGGHGTLVSGCIAPITDNGIGVAATAPGCKIMALRVGYLTPSGDGLGLMSYFAQAFTYAAANGCKVINLSYGTSPSSSFNTAIQAALAAGAIIFNSAGNDNEDSPGYLGTYNDGRVLSVAATNWNDGKSDFSNYGDWIDICAPGSSIYTTAYSWQSGESTYGTTQGTSFASPIAAGVCALIWSAHPGHSSTEIVALIENTCDNIDHLNPGLDGLLGHGRVNLLRALGDNIQLVPQEYADVQDAINVATPGDTVKILGSEMLSKVTVVGKGLQVLGGYDTGYVDRDPVGTPTTIDGNPTAPALEFLGAVDATTVVDGFIVQNGGGRTFSDIPYSGRYGGGMVISNQSPTLRNLVFRDNTVGTSSQLGCGGGFLLHNSDAVLENITVTGNTATLGAGVFIYQGTPTFTDVVVEGNTLITDDFGNDALGGGIHILDADVTFNNLTVGSHLDAVRGGGIYVAMVTDPPTLTVNTGAISGSTAVSNGGGIYINGGTLDLTDVMIADNAPTAAATFMSGGAIFANQSTVLLDGVTLSGNSAQAGGALQAAGAPDIQIDGSVITGNATTLFGGTVYLTGSVGATITSTTIADNSSSGGGAGINAATTPLTVSNTIVAFNTGGAATANGIAATGGATLNCNGVFGNDGANYGGVADPTGSDGNISVDPMFCDRPEGDYRVDPAGPCGPDNGGCGIIGALEAVCGPVNPVIDGEVPVAFAVGQNYPNPFNPITSIEFAIPAAARTTVVVYDVRGRMVKTLVDGDLPAATHGVQWRGDDAFGRPAAAGVYFYRVTSGAHTAVGRMALIK